MPSLHPYLNPFPGSQRSDEGRDIPQSRSHLPGNGPDLSGSGYTRIHVAEWRAVEYKALGLPYQETSWVGRIE